MSEQENMNVRLRALSFQDFDQLKQEITILAKNGYDAFGSWSLAQICQHLRIFFEGSVQGFSRMLPAPIRFVLYYVGLKPMLKQGKMRRGIKVPSFLLPEARAEKLNEEEEVQKLIDAINAYLSHTENYKPSPGFGMLTRDEWNKLHLIHAAHHLRFLKPHEA